MDQNAGREPQGQSQRNGNAIDLGSGFGLRPFGRAEAACLHEVFLDDEVKRFLCDGNDVERAWVDSVIADSHTDFAAGRGGMWTIVRTGDRSADSAVVGFVGVRDFFEPSRRQLIYALHPDVWGRGLATSAVRRVLRVLFEDLGWPRVEAATDGPNAASVRVLERAGFERFEPRGVVTGGGAFGETLFYELRRDQWSAAR